MNATQKGPETVSEQYAEAHETHHTARDLLGALRAYNQVIERHPDSAEAGYSRSQIANIVNSVVPAGDLLSFQTDLAVRHLEGSEERAVAAVTP